MEKNHLEFTGSKLELVDGYKVLLNGIDISAIVQARSIKILNQGDIQPPQAQLVIQPEEISIHMSKGARHENK